MTSRLVQQNHASAYETADKNTLDDNECCEIQRKLQEGGWGSTTEVPPTRPLSSSAASLALPKARQRRALITT